VASATTARDGRKGRVMRKAMGKAWGRVRASLAHMWESRAGRSAMILAAVLAVGCVFLWWLPKRQVAHLVGTVPLDVLFQRENEARQTWAGIIGGLVVFATLYFTWRRVEAAQQSVEVAREEQITERFTRAIEQLGSEKLEVRLGGIYALERIARDSAKDHWPTMEVLTACVRENATRKEREAAEAGGADWPPADIQAILTVIGRRRRRSGGRVPAGHSLGRRLAYLRRPQGRPYALRLPGGRRSKRG